MVATNNNAVGFRDDVAIAAMSSIISSEAAILGITRCAKENGSDGESLPFLIAQMSWNLADAMLALRDE